MIRAPDNAAGCGMVVHGVRVRKALVRNLARPDMFHSLVRSASGKRLLVKYHNMATRPKMHAPQCHLKLAATPRNPKMWQFRGLEHLWAAPGS